MASLIKFIQAIWNGIKHIWGWIKVFFEKVFDALLWLLDALGQALHWLIYQIYDGFLTFTQGFISAIDIPADLLHTSLQYSHLPSQLIYLIDQIAFGQGMAIIVGAITVRMLLNLIPAALTRV